jgi:hypothetical protein
MKGGVELKTNFFTLTQWVRYAMHGHWHLRISMEDPNVDAFTNRKPKIYDWCLRLVFTTSF